MLSTQCQVNPHHSTRLLLLTFLFHSRSVNVCALVSLYHIATCQFSPKKNTICNKQLSQCVVSNVPFSPTLSQNAQLNTKNAMSYEKEPYSDAQVSDYPFSQKLSHQNMSREKINNF